MAVPEARSSRLHRPGGRSRALGARYGTYHPLDTLGGPLLNLTCAELTLLALLLPQPELLGGAREGLIGQAAQVLFAGVVWQLEDLGVHGPEHELAYVEVVAQVDAVLRVDARLRARPGLELSSLGL